MWVVSGQDLKMTEGDYGVELPVKIVGTTLGNLDSVKFTIKTAMNGATLLEKLFSNISENTVGLQLTEAESEDLKVGGYVYALDWYQSGVFMCNIIPCANFKVVDKA